jgi:hypothetical protein
MGTAQAQIGAKMARQPDIDALQQILKSGLFEVLIRSKNLCQTVSLHHNE